MIEFTLLKSNCVLCGSLVSGSISLCEGCRDDLPIVEHACKTCALPMEYDAKSNVCGQCIGQNPSADYAINLFHYENPIDYLIAQMKFQQQLSAAAVLADLFKNHLETLKNNRMENSQFDHGMPDAILAMPLHSKRLAKRGFNQSLEIIKPAAKSLGIPILLDLVSRSKHTKAQSNLNKQQRIKNVSGCFTLLAKPNYSHIVIVDDVVTTGASTNELAKLLKKSGVAKVGVWSLARADLN